MVFWSSLKSKIKNIISRSEFDALKSKVDNDVVNKNNTSNLTVSNTANTIIRAGTTNITSTSGDIELRVSASGKSVNINNKPITGVATPTGNDHAATKGYVDNAIARIPSTDLTNYYNKSETNNLLNTKANDNNVVKLSGDQNIEGIKTFVAGTGVENIKLKAAGSGANYVAFHSDNTRKGYLGFASSSNSNFTIKNEASSSDLTLEATNRIVLNPAQYITCSNKKITGVATPTNPTDVATKNYVDNKPGLGIRSKTVNITNFSSQLLFDGGLIFKLYGYGINFSPTEIGKVQSIVFNNDTNNYIPVSYYSNSSSSKGSIYIVSFQPFGVTKPTSMTIYYL